METSGGSRTPAGWYPNPEGEGLRWWDGSSWTDHTHPGAGAEAQTSAAGAQAAAASQAGAGAVTGSAESAAAMGSGTGSETGPEPEREGPTKGEWALSALLPIIPLLGLIWGVYLIRKGDGREQAGNLAVILSLLVVLVAVLSWQL